jgi:hypothetical protein
VVTVALNPEDHKAATIAAMIDNQTLSDMGKRPSGYQSTAVACQYTLTLLLDMEAIHE